MAPGEIQIGFCYTSLKISHEVVVRKVISIQDGRVNYEFISGILFRKNQKFNSTSLKNFARWATFTIEELPDYSHLSGFLIQKNYILLDVSGTELMKCQEKKVNRYLKKGMLKWIDENTLQFTTDKVENRLREVHNGYFSDYMMSDKNQCCVVCGIIKNLTRHHVVPRKDLKYYPDDCRVNLCNRLTLCRPCHDQYELIKEGVEFTQYNNVSALAWSKHFIKSMKPKFIPNGWQILTAVKRYKNLFF